MKPVLRLRERLKGAVSLFEDKATRELEPAIKAAFVSEANRLGVDTRLAEVVFNRLDGWWNAKKPLTCIRRLYEDYGIAEEDLEEMVLGAWQDYHGVEATQQEADSYPNCKTVLELMVFVTTAKTKTSL